jgi:hypothetical protein
MNSVSLSRWTLRCRCSSCRFEFPLSMPPRYGHVLIMHLLAVECSQFLSSNCGSLELVVVYQYVPIHFDLLERGNFSTSWRWGRLFWSPWVEAGFSFFVVAVRTTVSDEIRYLLERERERDTHTHRHTKLGTPEIHSNAPITEVCIMSAPIYFLCASPVGTVIAYAGLYLSIKLFTSQTINTNNKYWSRHTWRRFNQGCHGCVCRE